MVDSNWPMEWSCFSLTIGGCSRLNALRPFCVDTASFCSILAVQQDVKCIVPGKHECRDRKAPFQHSSPTIIRDVRRHHVVGTGLDLTRTRSLTIPCTPSIVIQPK